MEEYFTQLLMALQSHIHLLRLIDGLGGRNKFSEIVLLLRCLVLDVRQIPARTHCQTLVRHLLLCWIISLY